MPAPAASAATTGVARLVPPTEKLRKLPFITTPTPVAGSAIAARSGVALRPFLHPACLYCTKFFCAAGASAYLLQPPPPPTHTLSVTTEPLVESVVPPTETTFGAEEGYDAGL